MMCNMDGKIYKFICTLCLAFIFLLFVFPVFAVDLKASVDRKDITIEQTISDLNKSYNQLNKNISKIERVIQAVTSKKVVFTIFVIFIILFFVVVYFLIGLFIVMTLK